MPSFGERSAKELATCHPDLQTLFNEVVKEYDCTVTDGYRGKEEQDLAVAHGRSKTVFPNSKHNQSPSRAADVVPFPVDYEDTSRFYHFAGFVLATAKRLGIKVRWGGDWDGDLNFREEKFRDLPHWELCE